MTRFAFALLAFTILLPRLGASPVVVPNANAATEGSISNSLPFGSAGTLRYQQVFSATQFGDFPSGGSLITAIAFRPDAVFASPFNQEHPSVQIDLSTTAKGPGALSGTFSENVGVDNVTVYDRGPLTISSSFAGPANGPKVFDITIPLATPFFYDPAKGNLLLDIRRFSDQVPGSISFDAVEDATTSLIYAFDVNASEAFPGGGQEYGLVTQFTFVPEPSALALSAFSLLAFARLRRRQIV
jgi:hypothetical protein